MCQWCSLVYTQLVALVYARMSILSNLSHCYLSYWHCVASVPQENIVVNRERLQAIADCVDRTERALASAARLATDMAEVFEASTLCASRGVRA
jgi:hypothetical protein